MSFAAEERVWRVVSSVGVRGWVLQVVVMSVGELRERRLGVDIFGGAVIYDLCLFIV